MAGNHSYPDPKFPLTRYLGKICEKHPELLGSRRRTNGVCHGCQADKNKAARMSPEAKLARAARARVDRLEIREAVDTARQIKEKIHVKIKVRARELAKLAGDAPHRDWGQYYQRAADDLRSKGEIPK